MGALFVRNEHINKGIFYFIWFYYSVNDDKFLPANSFNSFSNS